MRHVDQPSASKPSLDSVDRAHLTGQSAPTPPITRYEPSPELVDLIRGYWIPVWSFPPGVVHTQSVLQYPVCLPVVTADYARLYGVRTGLSTVDLEGRGWAAGVMLQPAAGFLLWRRSVRTLTDRYVDLETVPTLRGPLTAQIRATMRDAPQDPARHRRVIEIYETALETLLPVDVAGRLINDIADLVESERSLTRVDQLVERLGMSERSLQRLTETRLGLTPKWMIQRRRLHDAVAHLKAGHLELATVAHELGYTDQAHFTRDFRRVTGMTPGAYAADQPG